MDKKQANTGRKPLLGTLQQVAAQTGVPYSSVRKLVLDGHLPCVRLGASRRRWLKWADVDRLIVNSIER